MNSRARRLSTALVTVVSAAALVLTSVAPASASSAYTPAQEVPDAPVVPDESVEFAGKLFLSGSSLDEWPPRQLYSFDGTEFTAIDPSLRNVTNLLVIDDVLYFTAQQNDTWYVLAYDGTTVSHTGIESSFTAIEFVGYDTGIMAILAEASGDYRLVYFVGGTSRELDTFAFASGLTNFGGLVYFVATALGGSGFEMDRTDGTTVQHAVTNAGANLFVWNDVLYMGNIDQSYQFFQVLPDLTTTPGAEPAIDYAFNFFDAGDVLYFSGYRDDEQLVFSHDGSQVTALPYGPDVVGDFALFDGRLFATSVNAAPVVCAKDASLNCDSDTADVYYFDGQSWVLAATAQGSYGGLIAYRDRLYFQDGDRWMFIERATLPDTGLELAPVVGAAALLLALGLMIARGAAFTHRRRQIG